MLERTAAGHQNECYPLHIPSHTHPKEGPPVRTLLELELAFPLSHLLDNASQLLLTTACHSPTNVPLHPPPSTPAHPLPSSTLYLQASACQRSTGSCSRGRPGGMRSSLVSHTRAQIPALALLPGPGEGDSRSRHPSSAAPAPAPPLPGSARRLPAGAPPPPDAVGVRSRGSSGQCSRGPALPKASLWAGRGQALCSQHAGTWTLFPPSLLS